MKADDRSPLETALKQLGRSGKIELSPTDDELLQAIEGLEAESPAFSRREVVRSLRRAHCCLARKAVREAQKSETVGNLPFGRILQYWRTRVGLKRQRLETFLGVGNDVLERLEEGTLDPLKCKVSDLAKILDFFNMPIRKFKVAVEAYLRTAAGREGMVSALPRSDFTKGSEKEVDLSIAIDQLLSEVRKSRGTTKTNIVVSEDLEHRLRQEIRKLERSDLLD